MPMTLEPKRIVPNQSGGGCVPVTETPSSFGASGHDGRIHLGFEWALGASLRQAARRIPHWGSAIVHTEVALNSTTPRMRRAKHQP